jgi:hypothetical protein
MTSVFDIIVELANVALEYPKSAWKRVRKTKKI